MSNQDNKMQIAGEADVAYGIQCFQQKKFEEGFQAFMKAALKGNPGAMNNVSICFANGQGTAVDKDASFVWMKKSAEGGFTPAYFPLAIKYLQGEGTERSMAEAVKWARKANVEGNVHQEQALKLLTQIDEMIKKSPVGQARKAAADLVTKGVEYIKEKKYKEAFNCFMSAAMQGDLNAMHNVSLCFAAGQGVAKNDVHSFKWMKAAAEGGLAIAFFPMADKYLNGRGTERSLEQAEFWARKAAEVPNPFSDSAKAMLAILERENSYAPEIKEALQKGNELWNAKDYEGAVEQLEIAGKGGHAAALRLIGFAYLNGFGVVKNPSNAYRFLEAAAYRGDQLAASLIARGFGGNNKVALWKFYAQAFGFEGCEKIFDNHVAQEQKVKRGYSAALNAQQAMEQAAACWKAAEEAPVQEGVNPSMSVAMARPGFEKAMNYGNLDGVCGLAAMFEQTGNPEHARVADDMYRIAAYMGHSYAMYRMGQHYDEIDKNAADACYRMAARWKYEPAVSVCGERGLNI